MIQINRLIEHLRPFKTRNMTKKQIFKDSKDLLWLLIFIHCTDSLTYFLKLQPLKQTSSKERVPSEEHKKNKEILFLMSVIRLLTQRRTKVCK